MSAGHRTHWIRWRRCVQFAVALFYVALPIANAAGFSAATGTLVALKIGPVDLIEPAAALSAVLAGRLVTRTLLLGIGPLVLLAALLGPVFCSWVCPWGLLSEALDKVLRARHPWQGDPWIAIRVVRVVSLAAFLVFSLVLATPLAAFLSAPRLITTVPLELIYFRAVSAVAATLLAALVLLEMVGPRRLWCRALCPVGAFANFFGLKRCLRPRFAEEACSCAALPQCLVHCSWGIDPRRMQPTDGCTNCLRCIDVCPPRALSVVAAPGRVDTNPGNSRTVR